MSHHPLGWWMKSIIDRLKDERLTDEKYHFPKRTPASPCLAQLLFLSCSSTHLSCCCLCFDVSHSHFMSYPSAHTSRSVFTIYLSLRPSSSPSLVLLWNHLSSERVSLTDLSASILGPHSSPRKLPHSRSRIYFQNTLLTTCSKLSSGFPSHLEWNKFAYK